MKILKGIFVIISVVCIAFTGFFVYASCSGHTGPITKLQHALSLASAATGVTPPGTNTGSRSTMEVLTNDYGLTSSQASKAIDVAEQLGVDTSDPAEVSGFIAKNIGNKDAIENIANMYQSGQITSSQAKNMLSEIVNL